jgi:hypothetical protein
VLIAAIVLAARIVPIVLSAIVVGILGQQR